MKLFRYMGIGAIIVFSFFYTEKIADYTLKNNDMYKTIAYNSSNYDISYVNAVIDNDKITPGLNGKSVNVKTSYYNMKDLNLFNSYYLVYDTITPEVSIENNKDKIITSGNALKGSVAFVLEYNKTLMDYFKENNIMASVLVDINSFNKTETLEQINNDVSNFNNLDALLSKYSANTNICYLNTSNESICRKNKKYLVKSDKVIDKYNILNIKNNISSGDIYYVPKNIDSKTIQIIINNIMYKDLDIVSLSKMISEERD